MCSTWWMRMHQPSHRSTITRKIGCTWILVPDLSSSAWDSPSVRTKHIHSLSHTLSLTHSQVHTLVTSSNLSKKYTSFSNSLLTFYHLECSLIYHWNFKTKSSCVHLFQIGDSYMTGNCSLEYTCLSGGSFDENPAAECHELAMCQVKDGSRGCHCVEGYRGDGVNNCDSM